MEAGSGKYQPRRSGRTSKKAKLSLEDEPEGERVAEENSLVLQQKQKIIRGKRGRLAALIDMPVDILHEIFMHLQPYDILKLSRLNKQFRKLLMLKSSRPIWRSSIENVHDFPPCPEGWNEPRWINLCYDPHCHFCFKNTCRIVEWRLQTRICSKCAKELMEEGYIGDASWRSPNYVPYPVISLVQTKLGKRGRKGYIKSDLSKIEKEYNESSDRVAYVQKRRQYLDDVYAHARVCEFWAQRQQSNRSDELDEIRTERREAIVKELEALGYKQEIAGIRYPDSLDNHELVRKPQRLTPRIWANIKAPLLDFLAGMKVKRLAREYAQLIRERKLIAAEVLRKYKNARLPVTEAYPEVMDFCDFPPIKAVLELPSDVTVEESSFTAEVMTAVPALIQEWREQHVTSLVNVLHSSEHTGLRRAQALRFMWFEEEDGYDDNYHGGDLSLDKEELRSRLSLATTVFACKSCKGPDFGWLFGGIGTPSSKPLSYPQVLGHKCLTQTPQTFLFDFYDYAGDTRLGLPGGEPAAKLIKQRKLRETWSSRSLFYQHNLSRQVTYIVSATGLDPDTATVEEMDALDKWFACHTCLRDVVSTTFQRVTVAFRWRAAAQHFEEQHAYSSSPIKWTCMSAEEVAEAHQAYLDAGEEVSKTVEVWDKDNGWSCTHCRDLTTEEAPDTLGAVLTHVKEEHSVEDPQLNVDYFRAFEAGPERPFAYDIGVISGVLRNDVTVSEPECEDSLEGLFEDYMDALVDSYDSYDSYDDLY